MNPEIKAKWIAALRSGKYKRGIGQLRDKDEYCCLGVLCESNKLSYINYDGLPSDTVLKLIKLDKGIAQRLAYNNDGCADDNERIKGYRKDIGLNFKAVANWIEANL